MRNFEKIFAAIAPAVLMTSVPANAQCAPGVKNCPAKVEAQSKREAERKKDAANPNSPYGKPVKTPCCAVNNSDRSSGKVVPQ